MTWLGLRTVIMRREVIAGDRTHPRPARELDRNGVGLALTMTAERGAG